MDKCVMRITTGVADLVDVTNLGMRKLCLGCILFLLAAVSARVSMLLSADQAE